MKHLLTILGAVCLFFLTVSAYALDVPTGIYPVDTSPYEQDQSKEISWNPTSAISNHALLLGSLDLTASGTHALTVTSGTDSMNITSSKLENIFGLYTKGTLTYMGSMAVTVATGMLSGDNARDASVVGVYGLVSEGTLNNAGTVNVTASSAGVTSSAANADGTSNIGSIYGLFTETAAITNSGTVTLSVGGNGSVTRDSANSDDVTLSATATDIAGIYATASTVTNSANVTVSIQGGSAQGGDSATSNVAMDTLFGIYGQGAVSNSATVTLNVTGGTATGKITSGSTQHSSADIGTITTSPGTDDLTATGNGAFGVYSADTVTNTADGVVNMTVTSGKVASSSTDDVAGVYNVSGLYGKNSVVNDGAVTLTVNEVEGAKSTIQQVHGIRASDSVEGSSVTNTGSIEVTVTSDNAVDWVSGMSARNLSSTVVNRGSVKVTVTGGGTDADDDISHVFGLTSRGDITSTGSVEVTVSGGDDLTTIAGIHTDGDVEIRGDLVVKATTADNKNIKVYGALLDYHNADAPQTLLVTKAIAAPEITGTPSSSSDVYTVGFVGSGTRVINGYALQLTPVSTDADETNIEGEGSIGIVNDGGTITLQYADDAVLYVEAGTVDSGFTYDTQYTIPKLVDDNGTLRDPEFVSATTVNPDFKATTTSRGDTNYIGTIALAYAPSASILQGIIASQQDNVQLVANTVNNELVNSVLYDGGYSMPVSVLQSAGVHGNTTRMVAATGVGEATQATPVPSTQEEYVELGAVSVFAIPYGNFSSDSTGMMGYDSTTFGVTLGANYYVRDKSVIGLHLGYTHSNLDFTSSNPMYNSRKDDQRMFSVGVQGLVSFTDEWFARGSGSYYYTDHDYSGLGGLSGTARETASYDTTSFLVNGLGGYLLRVDDFFITPEAGLQYYYVSQTGFTTKSGGTVGTTYDSFSDGELYFLANLRFAKEYLYEAFTFIPAISFTFQQVLTDNELTVSQSIPGASPAELTVTNRDQLYNVRGVLKWVNDMGFFDAGYTGSFAKDLQSHTFWLQAGIYF